MVDHTPPPSKKANFRYDFMYALTWSLVPKKYILKMDQVTEIPFLHETSKPQTQVSGTQFRH